MIIIIIIIMIMTMAYIYHSYKRGKNIITLLSLEVLIYSLNIVEDTCFYTDLESASGLHALTSAFIKSK
jgi:hypothetical protein